LTSLSHDALPTRGAVRNLGDTDTGVVEIIERLDGAFDSLLGQYAGTCVEIKSLFHYSLLFNLLVYNLLIKIVALILLQR
jgi:hypothetical protein